MSSKRSPLGAPHRRAGAGVTSVYPHWGRYSPSPSARETLVAVGAAEAAVAASKMFLAKRNPRPYRVVNVDGFDYAVEDRQSAEDEEVALTLHELNEFGVTVIAYIGRLLDALATGALADGGDGNDREGIDFNQLAAMYQRLRERYSVDDMYESVSGGADTSYVINNGEEIHMCVRGPETPAGGIPDRKAVLFTVMTHELAHIGSSTPDHDEEFWANYAILRSVVARMGVLSADDIPADGGTHCQRIRIDRSEMASLSSDRVEWGTAIPAPSDDVESEWTTPREANVLSNPFYMQQRRFDLPGPVEGGGVQSPFARLTATPYRDPSALEEGLFPPGGPQITESGEGKVTQFDGPSESEALSDRSFHVSTPAERDRLATDSVTKDAGCGRDVLGDFDWRYGSFAREGPGFHPVQQERITLDHSGRYSRRPYAMGRYNAEHGESLHTALEDAVTYSRWTR